MTKVIVSKFDAIRAQIDAAIELYFVSDNIVATHPLTAAAYNLLRDIAKKDGSEYPFLKSGFVEKLSETERNQMIHFLNKPENFFKHANHDYDDSLSFDPELTEIMLIDACSYFKNRKIEKPKNYEVFKAWVGKIKDDINVGTDSRLFLELLIAAFMAGGKKQFWDNFSEHLINRSKVRS
jgi:hypothetical protein